jgi:hypothetical protein
VQLVQNPCTNLYVLGALAALACALAIIAKH